MNRIEEIKERIKKMDEAQTGAEKVSAWEQIDAYAVPDIKLLLSRLEIAEKALEVFAKDENWYFDDRSNLPIEFDIKVSKDPGEIAKEALQQLRS